MKVNNLFESAMRGQWDDLVEAYQNNPMARQAKITKSGDTALHIAAAAGERDVVLQLVEILGENASNILKIKNERGNTALHLAAALGDVDMCRCMATKAPELVAARNINSETPLFFAVLHGKKEAFLCLHFLSQENGPSLCRKNNGDTILHSAISGDYFNLVNSVNENGVSPLHILAGKPNAFKSCSYLGLFDRIIYKCVPVDELRENKPYHEAYTSSNSRAKYISTCTIFIQLIKSSIQLVFAKNSPGKKEGGLNDQENPQHKCISRGANISKKEDKEARKFFRLNTFVLFFKLIMKALLIILGIGIWRISRIEEKKVRHRWANLILNELVQRASLYKYEDNGQKGQISTTDIDADVFVSVPDNDEISQTTNTNVGMNSWAASPCKLNESFEIAQSGTDKANKAMPVARKLGVDATVNRLLDSHPYVFQDLSTSQKNLEPPRFEKQKNQPAGTNESPFLIAAKMGVTEIVEKILEIFPMANQDVNCDKKNVVLLAVEHRQTHVYELLLKRKSLMKSAFQQLDDQGNSALNLAAKFENDQNSSLIPGAALLMQWEIKWYKFIKKSMPPNFLVQRNNKGETPKKIFKDTHKDLVKDGSKWLSRTSESCSVIAALVATVAFTASATVPGGFNQTTGKPIFEHKVAFYIFSLSSIVALCFSVTALTIFLAILTSRYKEKEFAMYLPINLLLGLTSVFMSIVSILVSFCSGHFLVFTSKLRSVVFPLYIATCLPMTIFALAQLPLYFDLIWAIFRKVPHNRYEVFSQ